MYSSSVTALIINQTNYRIPINRYVGDGIECIPLYNSDTVYKLTALDAMDYTSPVKSAYYKRNDDFDSPGSDIAVLSPLPVVSGIARHVF